MIHCSLCFKTKDKPGDKGFFRVPKDERRRKEWSEICLIDFKKKTAWICKDHFLPSQIIKSGGKRTLLPNAVPSFHSPFRENDDQKNEEKEVPPDKSSNVSTSKKSKKKNGLKNKTGKIKQNNFNADSNVIPQEIEQENFVMEIPIIKSVFCTEGTQTNTRLCGIVQSSEFSDEFRFNCFYCVEVFPLEKWQDFTNHLKSKHFEKEKAFEIAEYVSEDHDYTPINIPPPIPPEPAFETFGINAKTLLPLLLDVEEPKRDTLESSIETPSCYYTPDDENTLDLSEYSNPLIVVDSQEPTRKTEPQKSPQSPLAQQLINVKSTSTKQKSLNINKSWMNLKQASKGTVLSRCLKRSNEGSFEVNKVEKLDIKKESKPESTEISFEYTPRVIIDLLLDSMKNYPILWQFNNEPFNGDFYNAVEDLCKIINKKWSLNIDNLKMRRSINRILRFYCYLFPNENIENIHEHSYYYDKCAVFLPSSVNEIAYARCSHCYICYKSDFDLKRHLLKEQKHNLQWQYKCVQCKECFKENDDYEFHKRLSHYVEVFRCEPCKKKFVRRNIYNRHMLVYHSKVHNETKKYECDVCDKKCQTINSLRYHKLIHRGRKFKCHLCPKSYFANSSLAIHLKSHRKEYDFMCEVCGKGFLHQTALNVHMNKHTGEKVTCSICNLKLRKSSLSRHLRLVHAASRHTDGKIIGKGKPIRNYKRLLRPKPYRRTKECVVRNYDCKVCAIAFEKYKLLAEHNRIFHSDAPKIGCKICNAEFRQKVNLRRHYRRKHNFHVIQAYKLVDENEDLNIVLAIDNEQLDRLVADPLDLKKTNTKTQIIKTEYLPEEISFEEEKIQSFTIQDEIMTATDNIAKEEIKIDYMNDFFTDILREQ